MRFCKYKCSGNRESCNIFYVYANNLYNTLFVFSVFGFRVMIYQRYRNVPNFIFCALFIFR